MAHDEKPPAQQGTRRDVPPAPTYSSGGARHVPPPWAGGSGSGGGKTRPNPVSWAIAELQEYLRLQPKVKDAEQIKQIIKDLSAKEPRK